MLKKIGLSAGLKLDSVRRHARHHDVIERLEGERPIHRVQRAATLMDKDHFVRDGIAIKLSLSLGRTAAQQ